MNKQSPCVALKSKHREAISYSTCFLLVLIFCFDYAWKPSNLPFQGGTQASSVRERERYWVMHGCVRPLALVAATVVLVGTMQTVAGFFMRQGKPTIRTLSQRRGSQLFSTQLPQSPPPPPHGSTIAEAPRGPWAAPALIEEDDTIWNDYCSVVNDIMVRDRVIQKLSNTVAKPVQEYLLSNAQILHPMSLMADNDNNNDGGGGSATHFRDACKVQKEEFLKQTTFNVAQYEYFTRCLCYLGDYCAKEQTPTPVPVAWKKLRESGLVPRENCVSTYMYVLSLMASHHDEMVEVVTFHDRLFRPDEKTVTLRIKAAISRGDARGAEKMLSALADKGGENLDWKRLRTFQPILSYYLESNDFFSAIRLFQAMRASDGVILDGDTYTLLISSMARCGVFRQDATPISGLVETLGCSGNLGPKLLDNLVSQMSEDLLELTEANVVTLYSSFMACCGVEGHNESVLGTSDTMPVREIEGRGLAGRVTIDESAGRCPATGAKLRLFGLTTQQRNHVHDTLLEMASSQHEEYGEKLRAKGKLRDERDGLYAYDELQKFSRWLQEREGEPFTAFVDGANVAYFGHGDVHYSQVKLIVDELEKLRERPLVTMPQKYMGNSFWLASLGRMQALSPAELDIMNELLESGKMYAVPVACLDDYYWMIASVANQTESKLHVSTDDKHGRFPGLRPMLVTNDQMRDHRLSLLEPREFRRWTSCHIVNYDINTYDKNEWEPRTVQLFPADFFSREIQGNPSTMRPGTMVWHIPVTNWQDPERFCLSAYTSETNH